MTVYDKIGCANAYLKSALGGSGGAVPNTGERNNSEDRVGSPVGGGEPLLFTSISGNNNAFIC